jgi:uncharacterized PurR-regulated membrane protein YhhQ (DUF165 family)
VRAFESRTFVGRRTTRVEAGVADGPYRLRGAADTAWPTLGYSQRYGMGRQFNESILAAGRMIVPVIFLSISFAAMYLYTDHPLPYFADAQGMWLTVSHFLLPLAFLTVHLTNRRYGPSYAFAQVVIALFIYGSVVMFGSTALQHLFPVPVAPTVREAASFVGAFFVAGFLSIVAFDGARGPRWWMAPLAGSIVAGLSYALIFYPSAFAGTGAPWGVHMAIDAAILVVSAVLGIFPYWLLRGAIQPLPGFGGY